MTRLIPPRFRRALLTLGVLAGAGGLVLGLTGAASASPLHPEFFNLSFPAATGTAYGPVHGAFTDDELHSGTAGVWDFTAPWGRVLVSHDAIDQPVINPRTCEGFLFQRGQWELHGLAGADRFAYGFGHFNLVEFVQVARDHHGYRHHRGQCDPDKVITENVYVTGSGLAANH